MRVRINFPLHLKSNMAAHAIIPSFTSGAILIGLPWVSRGGDILKTCSTDATIMKTVLSAKNRPGHMLPHEIIDTSDIRA